MKASTTTLQKSPATKKDGGAMAGDHRKTLEHARRVVLLAEDVGDHRELDDGVGEDAGVILLQLSLAGAASAGGVSSRRGSRRPRLKRETGKASEDAPRLQEANGKNERGSRCRTLPETARFGVEVAALRRIHA